MEQHAQNAHRRQAYADCLTVGGSPPELCRAPLRPRRQPRPHPVAVRRFSLDAAVLETSSANTRTDTDTDTDTTFR